MTAASIARALRGTRQGYGYLVRCPVPSHGQGKGDRTPSLLVRDDDRKSDGVDCHCFTGCSWRDVKYELRRQGLLAGEVDDAPRISAQVAQKTRPADDDRNERCAVDIWKGAAMAPGTAVERYLRGRRITLPIPPTLRYAPALRHRPTGLTFPGMVAAIQAGNRTIRGVHRTYLLPGGSGKARVADPKMALGRIADGAVRLAAAGPEIALAEGVETALSVMQMFGLPAWAAIGSRFARVALPDYVRRVVIFADAGQAGLDAAHKATVKFTAQRRKVEIRLPPDGCGDWNDALAMQVAA